MHNMHPLFIFLLFFLISLSALTLLVLGLLMIIERSIKFYEDIVFRRLKDTVKRNPDIGTKDRDGYYIFQEGNFTVKYMMAYSASAGKQKKISHIFMHRKLAGYEKKLKKFKRAVIKFWRYHKWGYLLQPRSLFPLLSLALLTYLAVFEPEDFKVNRFRWVISGILGIDKENVTVKPDGWVNITGHRITAVDKNYEDISYNVNLFDWFLFDDGYIIRDRGIVQDYDYGIAYYPVVYGENGRIDLNKDGVWIEGKLETSEVNWREDQGTGIRKDRVFGHDLVSFRDHKILIRDKEVRNYRYDSSR